MVLIMIISQDIALKRYLAGGKMPGSPDTRHRFQTDNIAKGPYFNRDTEYTKQKEERDELRTWLFCPPGST